MGNKETDVIRLGLNTIRPLDSTNNGKKTEMMYCTHHHQVTAGGIIDADDILICVSVYLCSMVFMVDIKTQSVW